MLADKNKRRLIIASLLILIGAGLWIGVRIWLFTDLPSVDDLSTGLHTPSMRITDRHGRLLYEVIGEEEGRHTVVDLESIPAACIEATIATEDAHFYTHPGIDLRAIIRAVWLNMGGGDVFSGGSTITQQVARNTLLDPHERAERTLTRKLREAILAYRLTQRYSKDDILALYLNQTYYGNLAYGIDAAARAYFGKPVEALGLAECAMLAGLPQAPALYDPLTDPEAASARQKTVLRLMQENDFISASEAGAAMSEQLSFAAERYAIEAPHFVTTVYNSLEATLPPEIFYSGGLEVRTTLDLDWQHMAQRVAQRQLEILNRSEPDSPPRHATGAAVVAMDPQTGQVYTMLGSPDFFNDQNGGAINMAMVPRQPGSALKPFTYAAAFDPLRADPMTAATMLLDVRTSFVTHEGYSYAPVNYDRKEHGPVLAREALASSYNVPAVIVLNAIGVDTLFDLLGDLGISTLTTPEDYDLALTLGGGDIRLLELTAAYAALAHEGHHITPVMVLEVKDANGQVILEQDQAVGKQVIDPRVAWLITDILSDNNARAPGFTTHSILQIGRPAAVKTGTTTDYRDNWTVGYTPDLVVGVWVGNTDNSSMVGISGVSGAGPIWHQFMRNALKDRLERRFPQRDDLNHLEICSLSGLLPTPDCPYTRQEWFIPGTEPDTYDTFYTAVTLDVRTHTPADETTPAEYQQRQIFLDLPPQAHDWARRNGLALLPDFMAGRHSYEELVILYPDAQNVYRISPGLPLETQRLRIAVAGPPGIHDIIIYMDGKPLATISDAPFEVWWILEAGTHVVYAEGITKEGQHLRSPDVPFTVKLD